LLNASTFGTFKTAVPAAYSEGHTAGPSHKAIGAPTRDDAFDDAFDDALDDARIAVGQGRTAVKGWRHW